MMDRNIIEQIVLEVMKQLALKDQIPSINIQKPKLLIVGDTSFVEPSYLSRLETKWDSIKDNESEKIKLDQINQVVFLHATQDLLAKGALGIFDTKESKLLSKCLLESVPVSIIPTVYLQEHLFNENPKNKPYVSQLQEYKQRLLTFGAKVETIESFIAKSGNAAEAITAKTSITKKKKLLTQRDVQDCRDIELVVDDQTIITPLARDTAREMGKIIKVIETKGAKR
ncbi:hypothetical protein [Neobacillus kokaensis]|uniref:Ethanolamine utilization protein n=1 Tax=Neobacillus kokaensis TaxID=2759023 RepID=A0ABQ3NAG3_9BACI|nr:hypothetical protein [Neobacillus kokaensis]GHH99281.1 hypothetical protein AM1BK_28240 [Neobacillus kokaensis]